jgi:acyl carrier protein
VLHQSTGQCVAEKANQNGVNLQESLASQVKVAIVRCLRMPIKPEEIGDDMLLFGEGLGLDSIDALEIVLELQRSFNVEISDEQVGKSALKSVSTIVQFIECARQTA